MAAAPLKWSCGRTPAHGCRCATTQRTASSERSPWASASSVGDGLICGPIWLLAGSLRGVTLRCRANTMGGPMPTKLSQPLLDDALTRLTGWAGDEQMIHREYVLDGMPRQRLLDEIESLAESTDHTIMLTDTDGGVDVSLATTDVDGVSEVDIAMASRLNDLFLLSTAIPAQRVAVEETADEPSSFPLL